MQSKEEVSAVQTILAQSIAGTELDPNAGATDGDGNPLQTHIEDDEGEENHDDGDGTGDGGDDGLQGRSDGEGEGGEADDLEGGEEEAGIQADGGEEGSLTIAQLAEAIEVDPEYLYDIEIGMGEGKDPVKLGQLKDDYQSVSTERDALVTENEALKSEAADPNSIANLGQGVSQEMIKAFSVMDNLQTQFAAVDWAAEEKADAGAAALLRQKFQEAYQHGQGNIQKAQNNMQVLKQENLKKNAVKMFEIIPTWKDETVRKADQGKMRTLMLAEGYNDQAVNNISDPRVMKMLNELVSLREYKETVEKTGKVALKKVRKAPKVLKGVGSRGPKNLKGEAKALTKVTHRSAPNKRRGADLTAAKAVLAASVGASGRR